MKTCKKDDCMNEVSGRATWCSDACRMAATRTRNPNISNPNIKVEHGEIDYQHPGSKGRFTRPDGSEYQLDALETTFEVTNGLVYQTVEDVRKCFANSP